MKLYERDYTTSDVASMYHVNQVTVLGWIKDGKLKATERYGCLPKYIISQEDLDKFDREYVKRERHRSQVVGRQKFCLEINPIQEMETDEEARLIKGLKVLSDILEQNPDLKDLILELADRA